MKTDNRMTGYLVMTVSVIALLSLLETTLVRTIAVGVFSGVAMTFACMSVKRRIRQMTEAHAEMEKRNNSEFEQMLEPVRKLFSERSEIIPVLIGQLKEVTDETEKAALDIVERFMSIVERAQNQSSRASLAVRSFAGGEEAAGGDLIGISKEALTGVVGKLGETAVAEKHTLKDIEAVMVEAGNLPRRPRFQSPIRFPFSVPSRILVSVSTLIKSTRYLKVLRRLTVRSPENTKEPGLVLL